MNIESIIGYGIGVIGIVYSIYTNYINGKRYWFAYMSETIDAIDDFGHPEISIYYRKRKIKRLKFTRISFCNKGNQVIDKSDVAKEININFSKGKIYSSYIQKTTCQEIGVKLTKHDRSIVVSFEYLNPNDGFIVLILHDAEPRIPNIDATVKGFPKGLVRWGFSINFLDFLRDIFNDPRKKWFRILQIYLPLLTGILYLAYAVYKIKFQGLRISTIVAGLILIVWSLSLLYVSRKRFPDNLSLDN